MARDRERKCEHLHHRPKSGTDSTFYKHNDDDKGYS